LYPYWISWICSLVYSLTDIWWVVRHPAVNKTCIFEQCSSSVVYILEKLIYYPDKLIYRCRRAYQIINILLVYMNFFSPLYFLREKEFFSFLFFFLFLSFASVQMCTNCYCSHEFNVQCRKWWCIRSIFLLLMIYTRALCQIASWD
jgi:hypothetical protein